MFIASIFAYISAGCAAALALAAALRAHRSLARWAFVVGMAVLALEAAFSGLSAQATSTQAIIKWQEARMIAMSFIPGAWLAFSLTYARGNGRDFLLRSRLAVSAAALLPAAYLIVRGYAIELGDAMHSPSGAARLGWAGIGLYLALLVSAISVVTNLERTFRASVGTMRWRIKFMLLGVGVLFVARIYTSSQILLFRAIDLSIESIHSAALIAAALLMLRSFFRAGHFNLDVYPSQEVLHKSVTILVAGVYLLIVGALAKVVTYLGGDSAFALKAFVVLILTVLLAVGLQSDHARLQLRRFVSRHFQRPLYDYRTMWKKFTEATASRVERPDLCRSLVALIADMFQTLSVSMWLVNDKRDGLQLVASTSLHSAEDRTQNLSPQRAAKVIAHFETDPEAADIEFTKEEWAAALRDCQPGEFANGGNRACVPMIRGGQLLGLIIVGDRVGGAAFSLQDFEMLKCMADHAAASLMNVQLSQRLLQAKELEAFQAMAAFFVHDLKNAASTLNLMLKNLPVHFDNPEFRADALRGISKTVTHINQLIGRLSALRHELKIQLAEADLSEVVRQSLAGLENPPNATLVKDLRPVPSIPLDREQLNKVVTNLILNATEAVAHNGEVRVTTGQENGWVVLTVGDNGCGMSPEFLANSLFRPFQTTKKNGLGIGMFQSKMIVEAHGGRISVASQPGEGTTFQVFLRAPTASA